MKKFFVRLTIASITIFLMGAISAIVANTDDITDKFVRFHIIGNSDSTEDQSVKMKVREEIFKSLNLKGINSKEAALSFFSKNQSKIEETANKTLEENGFPYRAKVKIGERKFPIREYTDFSLPSGTYQAVSIELGEAMGQNFFCVMYPGLCIIEGVSENNTEILNSTFSDREIKTITGENVVIKFKIAEIFNKIRQK